MPVLIGDTSGLVSLGIAIDLDSTRLETCIDAYDCHVPTAVVAELEDVASYDDSHGRSAQRVLDARTELGVHDVELDTEFPLDDGENAVVALANARDADLVLCDEFDHLGLVHASLANTRLVTTPTLLSALVRTDHLTADQARNQLETISTARSWESNTYVQRARSLLED
jgi:predicted nucleic acid-binding protein